MIRTSRTTARLAFTLIEVLVVIAIIAILASLLLAGVMMFYLKWSEMMARNDLTQLSTALDRFKNDFKSYPPHQIRLRSNLAGYTSASADTLDAESIGWIRTLWPNIGTTVPWAGSTGMPGAGVVLDPDQTLVFFLGGPPNVGGNAAMGLMGFSKNPQNPADSTTPDRVKYFDFEVGRLFNRSGNLFPSYQDAWKKTPQVPYLYFSSGKRANGYINWTGFNTTGVAPYIQQAAPTVVYYNSSKFQLICAGPDGLFGPGGAWGPGTLPPQPGLDDISNFHDRKLGSP